MDRFDSFDAWIGYRPSDQHRFYLGTLVPKTTQEAVVNKTAVSGSLADDPDVRAVLAIAGTSPSVIMGNELLAGSDFQQKRQQQEISAAASQAGQTWPTATFAGYAWTPTAGAKGTAQFITLYASHQEAAAAAAVLNKIWPTTTRPAFKTATSKRQWPIRHHFRPHRGGD